ncbi:MAG: hypothetical protein Q7S64_01145 [bacterium]|nr:hypothetical protein [bacterium]
MQRRLSWALLAVFSLTVLYVGPQPVRAMPPPGSIRGFLLAGGNQTGDVLRVVTFFHDPCDIGGSALPSYSDSDGLHTCSGPNKITQLIPTQPINTSVNLINERFTGQSIAYTVAVWLKPTTQWQPTNGQVMLFGDLPRSNIISQVIDDDGNRDIIYQLIDPVGGSPGNISKLNSPLTGNIGISYQNDKASGDNTDQPDLILTILYRNLPTPVGGNEAYFTASGYLLYPDPVLTYPGGSPSFLLKQSPRKQTISVEQGDIFIGNSISDRLLPNDHFAGQMFITSNGAITNANKCSWLPATQQSECDSDKLTQIGTYLFENTSTNAVAANQVNGKQQGAARDALRNAINKAAQENAQLSTGGNSAISTVQTTIRHFLNAPQTRWRYPNGQMLIFTQPVTGDVTDGSSIQVLGKKVVVFAGGGNIDFNGTVTTPAPAKVAFISLGNSTQTLIGPAASEPGGSTPHFDGAYVALDVTRDSAGNFTETGQINIRSKTGVDSNPLIINGLLAATNIDVQRQVTSTEKHLVRIFYDSTFAQGNLIGLSSLIRPLASGAK